MLQLLKALADYEIASENLQSKSLAKEIHSFNYKRY